MENYTLYIFYLLPVEEYKKIIQKLGHISPKNCVPIFIIKAVLECPQRAY